MARPAAQNHSSSIIVWLSMQGFPFQMKLQLTWAKQAEIMGAPVKIITEQ